MKKFKQTMKRFFKKPAVRTVSLILAGLMLVGMIAGVSAGVHIGHDEDGTRRYIVTESAAVSAVEKNGDKYAFAENEPMLVTDYPGVSTAKLANDISAVLVDTSANTTVGDGRYNGRYSSRDSYFIYRYKLPVGTTHIDWRATVGGEYGIYIAFSDENCPDPADASAWELIRDFESDNHDYKKSLNMTISYDVKAKQAAQGYVYLKFTDFGDMDGWGGRVCLGSDYPITMTYTYVRTED